MKKKTEMDGITSDRKIVVCEGRRTCSTEIQSDRDGTVGMKGAKVNTMKKKTNIVLTGTYVDKY